MAGSRLKEIRTKAGYSSCRELARELEKHGITNVSYITISRLEKGEGKPAWETISSLADFFGVSSDYLMGRDVVPSDNKNITPEEMTMAIEMIRSVRAMKSKFKQ